MRDRYLEGQVCALGSVLIDENTAGKVLHLTREEDYTGPYRSVYKAIREVFLTGKPVDPVVVAAALGHEYDKLLLELVELTATSANVDAYIDLVLEEAQVARLRQGGEALAQVMTAEDGRAALARLNRAVGERPGVRVVTMAQGIQDFYDRQSVQPKLLEWGMAKLDAAVLSEPGDFVVLGGYPSAGKTALSLQFAWHQAGQDKVGYFSLETRPEKLVDRAVALAAGLDFGKIKRRQLDQEDWTVCCQHAEAMAARNLDVIQAGGLQVADIQALALAGRYQVVYIDYLQLIRPENTRRSDFEQVSQISRDLHTMAQTTGMTVVALSQLSRPAKSGEQEKAPGLHSLRQSGQIEQDADAVMLLYKADPNAPASQRCLKVAKNKEGETGGILLLDFDGKAQRFTPAAETKSVAKACVQAGKKAKAKQASLFQEANVPDQNLPF